MIYFASIQSTIDDIVSATTAGINWAISVSIFVTAIFLAVSLISYLIQRS